MSAALRHETIRANGINLHCATAGSGRPVILLHGFPESWYCWRDVIPRLATRFRVIAPDMRGYGDSDKPPRVRDYRIDALTADVAGLIAAIGEKKAHVVGHDWGGAVAWDVAMRRPEVVDRLAVLNAPHPKIFSRKLWTPRQLAKSWYMFAFQIPGLAERMFRANDAKRAERAFRGWAIRKDAFSDEAIRVFKDNILKNIGPMVSYYRASFRSPRTLLSVRNVKIAAPTLLIWAEEDKALGKELTDGLEPLFTGPFKKVYIPHCSHWVIEEQPERVSELLLEHLSA